MTKQKQRLLKAKIAAALYHEEGRVPTPAEIEKWTKRLSGNKAFTTKGVRSYA